ncbi:MAG: Ig-like domain-containing protein [Bacteroidia bacterium]|nr:Ig-like domain-containing protein [Bacteroidia bacterium]
MHLIKETLRKSLLMLALGIFTLSLLQAQKSQFRITVSPENPTMNVGETLQLRAKVIDNDGKEVGTSGLRYFSRSSKTVSVDEQGMLTAYKGGVVGIIVIRPDPEGNFARADIEVKVNFPDPKDVQFLNAPTMVYTGTQTNVKTRVLDESDLFRDDLKVSLESSNPAVASVDPFGNLIAHKKGKITLTASHSNLEKRIAVSIAKNPVAELEIANLIPEAKTGDVIPFTVIARDKGGKVLQNVPIHYSYQGRSNNPSYTAAGMIEQDGRFVAYIDGMYSISANCGPVSVTRSINIVPRNIQTPIDFVGKGSVNNVHTSDLWVWEGVDGRDYAVTGTWGANGEAYFWDVTDPANIVGIDTFTVDARTVNDVKVSEDGKVCIISREGASNRKNGIVILDVTDPKNVKKHTEFNDGLTGGVHNLFIYKDHVYALSNGERYDIINIKDPKNPKKVGTFELDSPGHAIHDVWIEDGIAYSSNWSDGVQMVDIGNGKWGGTPEKPVKVASYAYPSGWNHAAFPFRSPSTGKFYIIAGDEAFPNGLYTDDKPTYAGGYLHVIDFTDLENPKEVAYYEVPGAGSHNFWIEGETLYVANYNAGLRVVDISGDLMGDLFQQGREMSWFKPTDANGRIPNAPMTWGPQPHKGHIFFSDWNSGLWSVKMQEKKEEVK